MSARNGNPADGNGGAQRISQVQPPANTGPAASAQAQTRVAQATFLLGRIVVGERHRKDMGDIDGLAAWIKRVGLLQPVGITPDGHLLWGERRLRACRLLGWREIPVTVRDIDPDDMVAVEAAENCARKDFALSEAVAIKRKLEPVEREAAKERMGSPEKFSDLNKGNALDKIAKVTGVHRTTLVKAEAIVDAAEAEPERKSAEGMA
jgi:ParB/RepB/Spo0J family partition protein